MNKGRAVEVGSRRGVTAVEMVIYAVIFVIFMAGVIGSFSYYRYSQSGIQRLDVLHQLRLSSFAVSEELSYGSNILFPPIDESRKEKPYHQLLFTNSGNEIILVFVDGKNQMMIHNLTKKAAGEEYIRRLTTNMIEFSVRRPANHYVEFEMTATDADTKFPRQFHLGNSARVRNVLR